MLSAADVEFGREFALFAHEFEDFAAEEGGVVGDADASLFEGGDLVLGSAFAA